MASPTHLPKAAPILKTGIKIPEGTGTVELIIENTNFKNHLLSIQKFNQYN